MTLQRSLISSIMALLLAFHTAPASADDSDIEELKNELKQLRDAYEKRLSELESKIDAANRSGVSVRAPSDSINAPSGRNIKSNAFNPSIGLVLNGYYQEFSEAEGDIAGFAVAEDGHRGDQGMTVDHTEFNFSANVDDKFYGSSTWAIHEHDGTTEVELEEAYLMTMPNAGVPGDLQLKFGRAFWALGYLNEQHAHADDFVDRPLPYRVFVANGYNDDGIQISKILPTDTYNEIGFGAFAGKDNPFGGPTGSGPGGTSMFYRVGGDVGQNGTWRFGAYKLKGEAGARASGEDGEEVQSFVGDVDMTVYDLRYTYLLLVIREIASGLLPTRVSVVTKTVRTALTAELQLIMLKRILVGTQQRPISGIHAVELV